MSDTTDKTDQNDGHGLTYKFGNTIHDSLPEGAQKFLDKTGITGLFKKGADGMDDFMVGDFMKQYGWAGALTLLFLTVFRGMGLKGALLVSSIVGLAYGQFISPLFNKAAKGDQEPVISQKTNLKIPVNKKQPTGQPLGPQPAPAVG